MTTFETIEKHEFEYGDRRFVQVSRKRAKDPEGEVTFLALVRGEVAPSGERSYRTNLTLPDEPEIVAGLHEALGALREHQATMEARQ